MDKIKLVVIDLDGTLLTDDKVILEDNIKAIEKTIEAGVQVVICTGRTLPGVRRFIAQLPFDGTNGLKEYIILQNGAVTHQLPNLEIEVEFKLKINALETLADFVQDYLDKGARLVAFDQENFYMAGDVEATDLVIADAKTLDSEITPLTFEEFVKIDGIYKAMIIAEKEVLDEMYAEAVERLSDSSSVVRSQPIIIEFLPQNVNKGTALKKLAEHLDIQASQIMALGDQLNDYEMLDFAGLGIKMANGVAGLDEVTQEQTVSNNEAGVARALEKHILRNEENI